MSTSRQDEKFREEVAIPEGVSVTKKRRMLTFTGPLGKAHRNFQAIPVDIEIAQDGGAVILKATGSRKRDYAILHTARSIVRNMCEGLMEGYTVRMKVVFAHFPITVRVDGGRVLIENFRGERAPRSARIVGGARVVPKGDDVVVTGTVLTDVTQTAANIQLRTKVKNKDPRVFLDGIYVYEKKSGMEEA